jgi:hypothetical protein
MLCKLGADRIGSNQIADSSVYFYGFLFGISRLGFFLYSLSVQIISFASGSKH